MSARFATFVLIGFATGAIDPAVAGMVDSSGTDYRDRETVVISAGTLSELTGSPVADLGLFRYDEVAGEFDPIPFQVDERFLKVFDEGSPGEFSETVYDVFGEEDGLLDADDEIAFVAGDAGPEAPIDGAWVPGADPVRFQIAVVDPRPTGAAPRQWVYLFTGTDLPRSPTSYVSWDGQPNTSVTTDQFRLDYEGNWLMTALTIFAPCGSGADMIDRFKGRAEPGVEQRQDEEDWSANSTYLGGLAGPIRAIRYVRGARSGVNTIHHDVIERSTWIRRINLRVHELDAVWVYFDWLPEAGSVLYTPYHSEGLPIDGVPDEGVSTEFSDWQLMSTPSGGQFVAWDVPQSTLFQSREFFYIDDASHNDIVPEKSTYPDDDDSAYGAHGIKIIDTLDSNLTPIRVGFRALPLCEGEGDAALASLLQELTSLPLDPEPVPQANCGAIRTLETRRDGADVVLDWQATPTAQAYRVYASDFADLPRTSWALIHEGPALMYRDVGASASAGERFYSVVCVKDGGEGPW